jgi:hypothetical protein
MTIPEIPDGATLPHYDLVGPRLANREVIDGGSDIKTVEYPLAEHYLQIGVVRRRTCRTSTGEKAPIGEEYAKENVAVRFQLTLGVPDGSDVIHLAKEIAAQQWQAYPLVIDGEQVHAHRWRQDGWSAVMYLTPTLIIYAILPDDHITQPIRLGRLA